MKPDRIPCEVPFCRRTASVKNFPEPGTRIICGKHFRLGDARLLRIYRKARRRVRRDPNDDAAVRIAGRMWDKIREQAIERAAGL